MTVSGNLTRRGFLKGAGGGVLGLSLWNLEWLGLKIASAQERGDAAAQLLGKGLDYRAWEDLYRQKWVWDKVVKGTHLVNCYPGSCEFNVYVKDGMVWREEQTATYPTIEQGVPDMNPRGCQKGCMYSHVMYGPERILYPLRRAGKRGEGKWKRISWDEALTEVADAVLDAHAEFGSDAVVSEAGANGAGFVNSPFGNGLAKFMATLGGVFPDINLLFGDAIPGMIVTLGSFFHESSVDDWFHTDLLFVTHMNALYTRIAEAHYITECRYRGGEVVSVAPDYNSSSIHADWYVPITHGGDAALFLGISKVLVDEGLVDTAFVKEQTDLPLLIRSDDSKFLRASDLEENGRDDQFYVLDEKTGKVAKAPRGTLSQGPVDPSLEGRTKVALKGGKQIEVFPVFVRLKAALGAYTPEKAAKMADSNADLIRTLARKMAKKRTRILVGYNQGKIYHGDLMARAQCLALALTGNFGKKGCGITAFNVGLFDGGLLNPFKQKPGAEGWKQLEQMVDGLEAKMRETDPDVTRELVAIELLHNVAKQVGNVPPVFWWYWHGGYREVFNKKEWNDPAMKRTFDEYFNEALAKGWWDGLARPAKETPPRVLFVQGTSPLRRQRGGLKLYLQHLWPQLKKIVVVDWRMSTTALNADIILPAAFCAYEKVDFRYVACCVGFLHFNDKAVEPAGESKPEHAMYCLLFKKIAERANGRGLTEYKAPNGRVHRYDQMYSEYTCGGAFREGDEEKLAAEMVDDTVRAGTLPQGTTLETLREKGIVRFVGIGKMVGSSLNLATDIKPNETWSSDTWHVGEKKIPWPTLTRRIQFYIDHDWFFEAGEELPVHKDHPEIGGRYPFRITSGHQRWSIHSIQVINDLMLKTHRGAPFMFVNPDDARKKGVNDNDLVEVFNDFESFKVNVKLSPTVRPEQVIVYHAWEPYQFPDHKSYDILLPGNVKWLHMVGGYGHLKFWMYHWSPAQMGDRAVAVDFKKI